MPAEGLFFYALDTIGKFTYSASYYTKTTKNCILFFLKNLNKETGHILLSSGIRLCTASLHLMKFALIKNLALFAC